jgi:hypothetical protein
MSSDGQKDDQIQNKRINGSLTGTNGRKREEKLPVCQGLQARVSQDD